MIIDFKGGKYMRLFVVSILILLLMVALGTGGDMYLTRVARDVGECVSEIEKYTNERDYQGAGEVFLYLERYWNKNAAWLAMLVDHVHIDEVSRELCELGAVISVGENTEIFMVCARLAETAQNIADNEHFCPENIL